MAAEVQTRTAPTLARQITVTEDQITVDGQDISAWVARDTAHIAWGPDKAPVLRVDLIADNISARFGG